MKKAGSLTVALAALLVAFAAWFGFDLEALLGAPDSPATQIETPAQPAPKPAPGSPAKPAADKPATHAVPTGDFDYYVLALSWSPSYCEAEATERDKLQCGGRPFHFIVHGLWPQNERGYPEDCPTDAPRVPDALVDDMLDLMPSRGLIGHEWRSHGACTGMSQEDYFAEVRAAFEAVDIPDRFEVLEQAVTIAPSEIGREFLAANMGKLTPDAIVVTCGGGTRLDEVRLCMDKQLRFRACGQQTQRAACRRQQVRMPPVRGATP